MEPIKLKDRLSQAKSKEPASKTTNNTLSNGKTTNIFQSNNEWTKSLNDRGIKTTHLSSEKETTFIEYGAALNDDLKSRILDSFDTEADYALQARIASDLFGKRSNVHRSQFVKYCKDMGFNIKRETVSTSYIGDYKNGSARGYHERGGINVYTISDPKTGAQIVIADANGNGIIESEELFMNEALSGIAGDLKIEASNYQLSKISKTNTPSEEYEKLKKEDAELYKMQNTSEYYEEDTPANDGKIEVTETEYKKLVKEYREENNCSMEMAQQKISEKYRQKELFQTA